MTLIALPDYTIFLIMALTAAVSIACFSIADRYFLRKNIERTMLQTIKEKVR